MPQPSLAQSANTLAAILGAILQMSDAAKNGASPLDQQGKLLAMQASIQKNGKRAIPYVQAVLAAVAAEGSSGQGPGATVDAVTAALLQHAERMERGELPLCSGPEALRQFALVVSALATGADTKPTA